MHVHRSPRVLATAATVAFAGGLLPVAGAEAPAAAEEPATHAVRSPDGAVTFTVTEDPDGSISYAVTAGAEQIFGDSPLGVSTSTVDFSDGLDFTGVSRRTIDDTYTLPAGSQPQYVDHANEMVLEYTKNGHPIELVVRAYDDGVAYRYVLPGEGGVTITAEASGFRLPAGTGGWAAEWRQDYEGDFPYRDNAQLSNGTYTMPLLASINDNAFFTLISEAEVVNAGGSYAPSILSGSGDGVMNVARTPDQSFPMSSPYPFQSPWRVAIIADDLDTLVNSDLIQHLNPPTSATDTSWVEPGQAAWSWWSDEQSASSVEKQKRVIDFAESMGFEYVTVDCCYTKTELPEMSEYAHKRGIRLFAWVTAESINTPAKADAELALLKSYGIDGVKVDFFLEDSQEVTAWYQVIAEAAERHEMMVNFHGSTKPGGENRTWPWVVTTEAVRGAEHYKYPPPTPARLDVTLPFVRNPLGSMDYTPVVISPDDPEVTQAHALAQSIVFTSAMIHYADSATAYRQWDGRHLMRAVPATWDETRVLGGFPGDYVTMARRSGDDWFIGTMTDEARDVTVPLDFLDSGTYTATVFADDADGRVEVSTQQVTSASTLALPLLTHGGASVHISRTPLKQIGADDTRYEAEDPGNTLTGAASVAGCEGCSGGAKVGNIDSSSALGFENVHAAEAGTYRLAVAYTAGDDTRSLQVTVNGSVVTSRQLPTSGGWGVPGTAYFDVALNQGTNTVGLSNPGGYSPDIDAITLARSFEAEAPQNTVTGSASVSSCAECSGGQLVTGLGSGATLTFHDVRVESAGNHTVQIDFTSAPARSADISVNGEPARTVDFHATGDDQAVATRTVGLELQPGGNTIEIGNRTGPAPDVDRIRVTN